MAAALDGDVVLGENRPEQALAVTEVVLHGAGIGGAGGGDDLPQADGVGPALGEQPLSRPDQRVGNVGGEFVPAPSDLPNVTSCPVNELYSDLSTGEHYKINFDDLKHYDLPELDS